MSTSRSDSQKGLTRRSFVGGSALLIASLLAPASAFAAGAASSTHDGEAKAGSSADSATSDGESSFVKEQLAEIEKKMDEQLGDIPELDTSAKIGILISSTSNEFWATMKTRYEEAAAELGTDIQIFEPSSETDTQGQLDALNTMLAMNFDVLIVSPINGTNLVPGVVAANEAGIPVINLGPSIDPDALSAAGGHIDAKITVSFEDQGKTCAEDLVKRTPEGGKVAILAGLAGAAQSEGRASGAAAVFEATDGIDLVANQACDWDTSKAYEATKDILTAHPDLKGIFACNDNMALAGVQALQEMGKTDVLVYGVDFTSAAREAMEQGTMTGSLTYSSAISTKTAERMALLLAQGGTIANPIYNPLLLVTKDNVRDVKGWK